MVDAENDSQDSKEVNIRENMDNNQQKGELVPMEDNEVNAEIEERRKKYQPSRLESFFAITKSLIIRAIIIYFVIYLFRRPQTNINVQSSGAVNSPDSLSINIFQNGTLFDLHVYLSESETFKQFNDTEKLIWLEQGLIYGDWYSGPDKDGSKTIKYKFNPSDQLKNNGSIYLHVYVTKSGKSPNPKASKNVYAGDYMSYSRIMLNKFKKIKYQKKHNLLTGETTATKEEIEKAEVMNQEYVSHWHPNLTINLVTDQTNWVHGHVPSPLDTYIQFLPGEIFYKPAIHMNDFWNMQRDYQPLNETVKELELRLTYQPLSLFKWQIYIAQTIRNTWTSSLMGDSLDEDDNDQDTLKETLLETNPYLLGLTIIISVLHSGFEFLAFKNDIQFWNNRNSLEGLSVRSVFFNVFQSLVVLLYVLDNETNTVVRISCAIGICIEVWKINKVIDINVNRNSKVFGIFPKISFHDKGSYVESTTKEYDELAFKYLSWALYPLLGGYAIYSLMYLEHKGWYSWILSMLYGFLLTFGFIMMTPQLFINYKLKSVAHLPWRMMSYKFLNTFIDDIFAFVIKMPTLYRIGCFRDDIVFFIFLYQRQIYKTDRTRVNEFGFSGEMENKITTDNKHHAIKDSPKTETDKKNK
ncbi:cleft lip and palate transmembrane protein 1 homolog isoform X1 [Colletes gigas]|uniref:cleft lip and palate transmembrane protein 1 homolog isoform X1 n=1 Tax=Colletes gigas TaxID=935657 RepID=UPI001C9AAA9E|nr:cleft lip and palate transmembrane protein 1 homolog isoform X1 [Colletes gigas]XP_043264988.1 cleft lip and palate transmembrane protein 1 homolog isoform X1 [Colletes gigas]